MTWQGTIANENPEPIINMEKKEKIPPYDMPMRASELVMTNRMTSTIFVKKIHVRHYYQSMVALAKKAYRKID